VGLKKQKYERGTGGRGDAVIVKGKTKKDTNPRSQPQQKIRTRPKSFLSKFVEKGVTGKDRRTSLLREDGVRFVSRKRKRRGKKVRRAPVAARKTESKA
jgi:hypothetical protein